MSNARRLSQRARALRVQHVRLRTNNHIRAPAHGLLGNSLSQSQSSKTHRKPLTKLRQSQQNALRKKGAAAEMQRVLVQLPQEVDRSSSIPLSRPPSPLTMQPMEQDPPQASAVPDDDDDGWSTDEELDRCHRVEQEQGMPGIRVEYRDYRSRRNRTDVRNTYWGDQIEDLVDAYLSWCLKQRDGCPVDEDVSGSESGSEFVLEVIDVFGANLI
ncbi:hypothetical protein F5878DRAFT_667665 [Lentinula raphanica]|uniref:Uncharacterized protein n=1 Tax=Lentinula raphanica TaxID=153919 RepID=A0AA38NVE7_9AGAR|nr:hypothetical protein F5878DRAFT_667665 [Lentinula raphanica]